MEIDRSKIFQRIAEKKKGPAYQFQEACGYLSEQTKLPFGTCLSLWKKIGNDIYKVAAEIKQGEHKNPRAFVLSLLKNKDYVNKSTAEDSGNPGDGGGKKEQRLSYEYRDSSR